MPILIQNRLGPREFDLRTLAGFARRVVAEALRQAGADPDAETSVLFVGDEEMRALNNQYRRIDRPTDVLAFAMSEAENAPAHILGDVVVSIDTARRQARERGHTLRREIAVLLVHGTLHLLGHDHEPPRAAAKTAMRAMEKACLKRLEEALAV